MDELLLLMKLLEKDSNLQEYLNKEKIPVKEKEEIQAKEKDIVSSNYNKSPNEHFNESYAKFVVSKMYHNYGGCKCVGEVYSMERAKEIHAQYSDCLSDDITCSDMYVALNAQYHDYHNIFMNWFSNNMDDIVIETAISFWFKDEDYDKGFKLWNYFCN